MISKGHFPTKAKCVALMVGLFCSGEADNALGYLVYYLIQLTENSKFGDSTAAV